MGWELELTDAVYNNDLDLVRQYLQSKEVKKSLGESRPRKNWVFRDIRRHSNIQRTVCVL